MGLGNLDDPSRLLLGGGRTGGVGWGGPEVINPLRERRLDSLPERQPQTPSSGVTFGLSGPSSPFFGLSGGMPGFLGATQRQGSMNPTEQVLQMLEALRMQYIRSVLSRYGGL